MDMRMSRSAWASAHWDTSPMLSSTATDDDNANEVFDHPELTSDCRHSPALRVAISVPANDTLNAKRQDVRSLNQASFRPLSPAPRFTGFSPSPDPDVSLNTTRPRTTRIFSSSKDLAAHHGIPQTLPPPPRPVTAARKPAQSNSPLDHDLAMRVQTHNTRAAALAVAPSALESTDIESTMRELNDYMASPEFKSLGDSFDNPVDDDDGDALFNFDAACGDESPMMSEYLTSPFEASVADFTSPLDTPYADFLPTPAMSSLGDDFGTGPLITSASDWDLSAPLFGDAGMIPDSPAPAAAPKLPDTANLWEISPATPLLDAEPAVIPFPPLTSLRQRSVTGTRPHLTPAELIPLDAPTQRRNYLTPSVTSRKAVPATFARKRGHSAAFGDDGEELPPLSPTASEAEMIEHKRRQNTIAARKSRKRKLMHQQELEENVSTLEREVTMWRERALMAQEMLRGHGVMFSFDGTQP
ncbi:hypothetical protein FB45DRAFT_932399 [Roridomyces roridus]|uniref:BZIP domain-containing protein n=1 Tax=Roridomyces roridus TaxID=1738132 RepID=A0AAD7BFA3_9AGAR|nr:hypothetical protein FB45DRAFT_932399 [Roridomyces roridus]